MPIDTGKYSVKEDKFLRDTRSGLDIALGKLKKSKISTTVFVCCAVAVYISPVSYIGDFLVLYCLFYFRWLFKFEEKLPFRLPQTAGIIDVNNKAPGTGKPKMSEGILYVGNKHKSKEELWFTNSDARTHVLYLGTTGSGKTEGLKSFSTNALGWGSGFVFVDGKGDTSVWAAMSSLCRRFGRDDDLYVLNYMTGNSDDGAVSNTINPFSAGSASYLTNLLVSLMPESGGDNSMWKDRAVSLMSALMPVLTWLRAHRGFQLGIATIRDSLLFKRVVQLSRDPIVPQKLRKGLIGYLDTLPGYDENNFNDDGTEKPGPNGQVQDMSVVYQQHGYLSMQFTRQLQSLADDYGYIFEKPVADIDMSDVVLNRRILFVMIPALEKSADESANLGKIVGAMLKGMMGSTLGSTIEGDVGLAIDNKPTEAPTPFMAIFDEVGYYVTEGMAVMAAQARSLGFCLIYAAQDLPALEKRVKEEARSITANCNLKIFGKLEDPTQTKEFFEKTVGETMVAEASSQTKKDGSFGTKDYKDSENINVTSKAKASYAELKSFSEGDAIVNFGDTVVRATMFFSNPDRVKALRVNKLVSMNHPDPEFKRAGRDVDAVLERFRDRSWRAAGGKASDTPAEIKALVDGIAATRALPEDPHRCDDFIPVGVALATAHALGTLTEADYTKAKEGPKKSDKQAPSDASKDQSTKAEKGAEAKSTPDTPQEPAKPSSEAKPKDEWSAAGDDDWGQASDKTETNDTPQASAEPVEDNASESAPTDKPKSKDDHDPMANTISWDNLVDDKPADDKPPESPAETPADTPKSTEKTPEKSGESPSKGEQDPMANTISWDSLVADDSTKDDTAATPDLRADREETPQQTAPSVVETKASDGTDVEIIQPSSQPEQSQTEPEQPQEVTDSESSDDKKEDGDGTVSWEDLVK